VTEHVVDCVRLGMQGGFHAIGDHAISTVIAGYRAAAATVGLDRLRAGATGSSTSRSWTRR
jgi:predicted amidohydrolase YtcJ